MPKIVVAVWGTFDVIHKGHIEFLEFAKKQGDELHVIIVPDFASVENKEKQPKNNAYLRAKNMEKLSFVTKAHLTSGFEETYGILENLKITKFVIGHDQNEVFIKELISKLGLLGTSVEIVRAGIFAGGKHQSDLEKEKK